MAEKSINREVSIEVKKYLKLLEPLQHFSPFFQTFSRTLGPTISLTLVHFDSISSLPLAHILSQPSTEQKTLKSLDLFQ